VQGDVRAQVRARVEERFEAWQVPLLQRLVEQPSCTRAPADVEAASLLLDAEAEALGLTCEVHPDPAGRVAAHRVYRAPSLGAEGRGLALVGHVDTVFPRSMGFLAFERDGDVVRGPGVLDMKSGLCAMFGAWAALRAACPDAASRLAARWIVVSDEETGSPSSADLYRRLSPLISEALVFEAGRAEDRIVTRRRGSGVWTLHAKGRASHAGNAHAQGINAIHALALLVPRIEAMTDHARGRTLNVGLFEGGTAKNTVPERASLGIDGRFGSSEDEEAIVRGLERLVRDPFEGVQGVPDRLRQVQFTLEGRVSRPPMEATDATQALRARYEQVAAECGLGTGEAPLQGGGSDANLLAAHGVPCIDGLGPFGRHFHETEEWSSLDSLRRRTEALALFLLDAAGG
jgi:glutamate carboxypeptidase